MSEESQKSLDRRAWNVLILATIFWIADGYDTFVLLITARPTLHDILPPRHIGMNRFTNDIARLREAKFK